MARPRKTPAPKPQRAVQSKQKMDGLVNTTTGYGTSRAKVNLSKYKDSPLLSPEELEVLFAHNDLAATIVEKPVEDALREGFCLESEDDSDQDWESADEIKKAFDALNGMEHLKNAVVFGRLFGDAGVIPITIGGGALSQPLDEATVRGVESLIGFDRQDLAPETYYPSGEVETYRWTRPTIGAMQWEPKIVHESRLVFFTGATTTTRRRQRNLGWHLSVLQRVYEALRSFDSAFAACDAMFADASQAVFKLQGLIDNLASSDGEGDYDVETRLRLMDLQRSVSRAIVLDAGDESNAAESFEVVDRKSFGTLGPMLEQYYVRLCTAARMPLTVLLGTSPAGQDATGESDLILYFNSVDVMRRSKIEPGLVKLLRLVEKGVSRKAGGWKVRWPKLIQPKPVDVATSEKMQVDSMVALITSQVLVPEEVGLNLERVIPSMGLRIDRPARIKALREALAELENREMTSPSEAPEMEPEGVVPPENSGERKTPAAAAGAQT